MVQVDSSPGKMTSPNTPSCDLDAFQICDKLRAALLAEIRNPLSRLAGITDCVRDMIAPMIRPQPRGVMLNAKERSGPVFMYEYAGRVFPFGTLSWAFKDAGRSETVRFNVQCSTDIYELRGSRLLRTSYNSKPVTEFVGRLPARVVGMHLIADSWDSYDLCFVLDADGTIRQGSLASMLEA